MLDLTTITVANFQALFGRDFPYLPTYNPDGIYNQGNITYYNGLFFECRADGTTGVTPVQGSTWNKVPGDPNNYVQNQDIMNAFSDSQQVFNQALWGTNAQIQNGYLYLTAHFLTMTLRTAIQGLQSVGEQMMGSRSAGGISVAYDIPQQFKDDPVLAVYTTTAYGMKYLALALPNMRGNFGAVQGDGGAQSWGSNGGWR